MRIVMMGRQEGRMKDGRRGRGRRGKRGYVSPCGLSLPLLQAERDGGKKKEEARSAVQIDTSVITIPTTPRSSRRYLAPPRPRLRAARCRPSAVRHFLPPRCYNYQYGHEWAQNSASTADGMKNIPSSWSSCFQSYLVLFAVVLMALPRRKKACSVHETRSIRPIPSIIETGTGLDDVSERAGLVGFDFVRP